ncbi:unnamed protein product [Linum trigynum]|uniref:Uncharacterized protein n=1 Tax=Linum trigynum TaxID=586398 RepID=A0AAV2CXQ5_9ROSI
MRGANHEDKMISPLFPRLHVSETEKEVGPRAPPRNKMAAYEQLSTTPSSSSSSSRRFSNPSMALPLPPNNFTNLLPPSVSSTHVGVGAERNIFVPFSRISGPSHLTENKPFINFSSSSPMNSLTLPQIEKCSTNTFQPQPCSFPTFNTNLSWSTNDKLRDHHQVVNFGVPCSAPQSNPLQCSTSVRIIKKTAKTSSSFFPSMQHQIGHHGLTSRHKEVETIVDLNARIQADRDIARLSQALLDPVIERCASASSIRTSDSSPDPVKLEDHVSPHHLCRGGRECDFLQESVGSIENNNTLVENTRGVEKLDGVSETSGTKSHSSSSVITPNHVKNVVGEMQFWKARKVIINQQRTFVVQVFELHRLVQVQKLIARSSHLLLQRNSFTDENMIEPRKKMQPRCVAQKPIDGIIFDQTGDLSAFPKLHRLDYEDVLRKSPSTTIATTKNMKPPPLTTTNCLQAGNQWLVPVMSPSEGLVYKPYSGPSCPPTSSFTMASPYYGAEPYDVAQHREIFTTINNHAALSQHAYFPPFGRHLPTPLLPKENHISSVREVNKSTSIWNCPENRQVSKEGRTTTRAIEKDRWDHDDALPLFPLEPMVQVVMSDKKCQINEQRTRVIKVVPHNPISASESAARIFRFIQEERKQNYS